MYKQKIFSSLIKYDGRFILASSSPRRKKLLEVIGIEFDVITADVDEENHNGINPIQHVKELAFIKASKVANQLNYPAIVLGADTIVVLDNYIINKPNDEEDAYKILRKLSGRTHTVYTGIALIENQTQKQIIDYQETKVRFRQLEDNEIYAYIASGSPMDKAGAYGIQDDLGAVFVNYIEGCYYNIVGLPLELLYRKIIELLNTTR